MVVNPATNMFHIDPSQVREKLGDGEGVAPPRGWELMRSRVRNRILTLLWLWGNGFPSKLKLAAVADDDRDPRAIFVVCRNVYYFRYDIFIPTNHPTKHHMFA
jgi:hypothetical protein